MGSYCPSGYTSFNGVCYGECPSGYTRLSTATQIVCVSDAKEQQPHVVSMGTGYAERSLCQDVNVDNPCQLCGDKWYAACEEGYKSTVCGYCTSVCPDGSFDKVCGNVVISPDRVPESYSWTTLIIVLVVLFVLAGLIYGIVTGSQPDVIGVVVGDPTNDTFSSLQRITTGAPSDVLDGNGERLIYV